MTVTSGAGVNGRQPWEGVTTLARAALWYARRGWAVFPCCWPAPDGTCGCGRGHRGRDIGKAPLTTHGFKDARTDPDTIRRWWRRWPQANVAIAAGLAGLAVVDIDDPDAWLDLANEGRELPDTPTATTGRGCHLYYAGAAPSGTLVSGVEIKSEGGYVLAPPSRHRSWRVYTWETTPREREIAPLPDWIVAMVRAKRSAALAAPLPAHIPAGARNTWLTSIAGSLRRRGCTEFEILNCLRILNESRCDPPLDQRELARIAASVGRYAPAEPGTPYGRTGLRVRHAAGAPGLRVREVGHGRA